jgi:hypothetical protein
MQSTLDNEAEITDCYVYCFCSVPAPGVRGIIGIRDSQVNAVEHDGVIAITADCSRRPDPSVPNLIAHNRVVSSVLEATTPIPCRFGTVLNRSALETYVKASSDGLKALLGKVRGCIEMTLRVTAAADMAMSPFEDVTPAASGLLPEPRGPGAQFLAEKMREANRLEIASRRAQALLDWVDSRFGALVKDSLARPNFETSVRTDVAHLVERPRLQEYHQLLGAAQTERPELRLSISGPWAPYSFAVFDGSAQGLVAGDP